MVKRSKKVMTWIVAVSVVGALLYGLSLTTGVAYDDTDIAVVDFSLLDQTEKRTALQTANRARCTCGCGMGLAQCVVTDSTCPLRPDNIARIRTIVEEADEAPTGS